MGPSATVWCGWKADGSDQGQLVRRWFQGHHVHVIIHQPSRQQPLACHVDTHVHSMSDATSVKYLLNIHQQAVWDVVFLGAGSTQCHTSWLAY
jgi:hypothetical protein